MQGMLSPILTRVEVYVSHKTHTHMSAHTHRFVCIPCTQADRRTLPVLRCEVGSTARNAGCGWLGESGLLDARMRTRQSRQGCQRGGAMNCYIRMPWGKYRDRLLCDIPGSYLFWV